ncbi:MAG TPA: hypothetical protein PKG52_04180 [bacterium]|nr:hypothetical protein [bacterium]HPS28711.1 hypothetical protein [bacterium]
MKFIYLTCNISKLEQILELLKMQSVKSYQVIENADGVQPSGNPRMNNAVWPGSSSIVMVQADKNETEKFFESLTKMNQEIVNENERVLAVSWDCERHLYFDEGGK